MVKKLIKNLAFTIIMLFSIFGFIVFGTVVHELYHYYDFKEIVNPGELCFLTLPLEEENVTFKNLLNTKVGYYRYSLKEENITEYSQKEEKAELKAYTFESVFFIIFLICFVIVLYERMNFKLEEKYGFNKQTTR